MNINAGKFFIHFVYLKHQQLFNIAWRDIFTFTFYHVIQFLYPMQWLILAGAIIEKRNMGIGPIKIQQPYPHHDKSFQRNKFQGGFQISLIDNP